jgi:myosin protein heavy chain
MTRTVTQYSSMIATKDKDISKLEAALDAAQAERARSTEHSILLQAEIDTLAGDLEAQRNDQARSFEARQKLQEELDELRSVLAEKHSEDSRRSEVEKSMEVELADLRGQVARLQQDLSDARRQALEGQNRLKVVQETAAREQAAMHQAHQSLLEKERAAATRLQAAETAHGEAEKFKRSIEAELISLRTRYLDIDGQLSDAVKAKEVRCPHDACYARSYEG